MDATHNHQGILSVEKMIERVHGIARHKQFSTISVLNHQGEEVQFLGACREFLKHVEVLRPTAAGRVQPEVVVSRTPCGGMNIVASAMKSSAFQPLVVFPTAGLKSEV
jgi:hypothetical protein